MDAFEIEFLKDGVLLSRLVLGTSQEDAMNSCKELFGQEVEIKSCYWRG